MMIGWSLFHFAVESISSFPVEIRFETNPKMLPKFRDDC